MKHVDNFLKAAGMPMTMKQYYEWIEEVEECANMSSVHQGGQNKKDKKKGANIIADSWFMKEKYKKVIELAKEDWLLSTDGMVKALRYDKQVKQFVAKVQYKKGSEVAKEMIRVSDDWIHMGRMLPRSLWIARSMIYSSSHQ